MLATLNYHELKKDEDESIAMRLEPPQFERLQRFMAETSNGLASFGKTGGCRCVYTQYASCVTQKCHLCSSMICSCGKSRCLNADSNPITSVLPSFSLDKYKRIQACPCCSKRRVCYPCSEMIEDRLLTLPCCENTLAQCR